MVVPIPGYGSEVFLSVRSISSRRGLEASLLMVMLAMLMFNAGLGLKCSDLKDLMQKKYLLAGGVGGESDHPHRLYLWHDHSHAALV